MTIEQLSDFEPKGEACRAFGVYHPGGFPQRALVIVGPDGVVKWSYEAAVANGAARRQPDLRRSRCRRRGLTEPRLGARPCAARRGPHRGTGRRAAGDRVRRLRVPVLRRASICGSRSCGCGACSVTSRCAPAIRARGPRRARPRRRRSRVASGRCTSCCSPTRGGSRIRTCGSAPGSSGSTLTRFDADRRSDAVGDRGSARLSVGRARRSRHDTDAVLRGAPVCGPARRRRSVGARGLRGPRLGNLLGRRNPGSPAARTTGSCSAKIEPWPVLVHRAASAVPLGDRVDDRQAQPDAAVAARPRRVGAREPVEDPIERLRRHAAALVLDLDQHRAGAVTVARAARSRRARACT